eukprot:scaffold753_cov199-Alexandrium_tamarense.AAC.8
MAFVKTKDTLFLCPSCVSVWGGVTIHFNLPEGANAAAKGLKLSVRSLSLNDGQHYVCMFVFWGAWHRLGESSMISTTAGCVVARRVPHSIMSLSVVPTGKDRHHSPLLTGGRMARIRHSPRYIFECV